MITWLHVTLIVALAVILVLLFLLIFQGCFQPKTRKDIVNENVERVQNLQDGIARLHQVSTHQYHHRLDSKKSKVSTEPLFSWADHPCLVTDAVGNGWSRFAFTTLMSSPSVKSGSALSGSDHRNQINVEISWVVGEGSAEYMQKVRLNPGLNKIITNLNSSMGAASAIRTALPLPGPHLGNSSFPQEAYFEITILPGNQETRDRTEGDKIKLIEEDFNANLTRVTSSHSQGRNKIDQLKLGGKNEAILVSVGLTGGGPLHKKIPGSFPGSIGFNSSGSVYLDGTKIVPSSEKDEWERAEKVIGCGYNPGQKKVFFTIDSQLVHEIHCKTEEYSSPLYPTLAANTDILVLVNLGQSPFKFAPGNLQRTPNPCFIRPQPNSPDSKELFSIGRIDSQWLQRSGNNNTVNSLKSIEFDGESDSDLFEIILDSTGRSLHTTTYH